MLMANDIIERFASALAKQGADIRANQGENLGANLGYSKQSRACRIHQIDQKLQYF